MGMIEKVKERVGRWAWSSPPDSSSNVPESPQLGMIEKMMLEKLRENPQTLRELQALAGQLTLEDFVSELQKRYPDHVQYITPDRIQKVVGVLAQQPGQPSEQPTPAPSGSGPNTGPLLLPPQGNTNHTSAPKREPGKGGEINLVNYRPEEIMFQINQELDQIEFGQTKTTSFMENYSELWALIGPIVLIIGTIGEVFIVLWTRQKHQDILAGLSIIAVALVLEGTFLAVSYKAATIRNRAERRPDGPTGLDKKKLLRQFAFWFTLAFGVCATQVIFVVAGTHSTDIGEIGVWIFAGLRAVFTLIADGYTAFAHEQKPTTGEQKLAAREERAKVSDQMLGQAQKEVNILNKGGNELRRSTVEAEIEQDNLKTELESKKMENKNRLDTLNRQQEQARMFTELGNNVMRALFDPTLPEEQRETLLGTMQALMGASRALPQPKPLTFQIEEEKDDEKDI